MKIGKIKIENGLFLAPMAGVTDIGFRAIAKFFGAEITCTEMISAKGLVYGKNNVLKTPLNPKFVKKFPEIANNKTAWLLITDKIEDKKVVQFFGSDSEFMQLACKDKLIEEFDIVDINMGCPAPKIIKNGEGSALMSDMEKAKKIVEACVKATDKLVSVKFRKGFKLNNAVEFTKMCEKAGAGLITIHGRLMSQGYSGKVDYDVIKEVKEAVKIPVVGSGDVKDIESYEKMIKTGVDGVMIGRASLGNQIIFKQISEYISGKVTSLVNFVEKEDFFKDVLTEEDLKILKENELYIKYICAKKHISILREYYSDKFLIKYMRKHMLWYAGGLKNKSELKSKLALSEDLDKSLEWLREMII